MNENNSNTKNPEAPVIKVKPYAGPQLTPELKIDPSKTIEQLDTHLSEILARAKGQPANAAKKILAAPKADSATVAKEIIKAKPASLEDEKFRAAVESLYDRGEDDNQRY